MTSKKPQPKAKISYIIAGVLVVVLAFGTYLYYQLSLPKEQIMVMSGVVTETPPPLTDTPLYMTVDGVALQVAQSGLTTNRENMAKNFTMDIFSIKKGDTVEVNYLKTGDNHGTLNCNGCFIKKGNAIFRPIKR